MYKARNGLLTRRQVLRYGLAGMMAAAGGVSPAMAGDTDFILGTKNGNRPDGTKIMYRYTILLPGNNNPVQPLPNIHPRLEMPKSPSGAEKYGHDFTMVSVQEENLLRVRFYAPGFRGTYLRFDLYNPTQYDFTGIPARYRAGEDSPGVVFGNGMEFDPYLPPDAQPIGTEERRYEMRWRRVYANYYYITVYRGATTIICDSLFTEQKGLDISQALGESSVNADRNKYDASWGGYEINLWHYIIDTKGSISETHRLTLLPVYEKDLPPDFPKDLVRWIP